VSLAGGLAGGLAGDRDAPGEVAAVTCTENILTAGDAETATFHSGKARALNVFAREEAGWRLWIHQASPVGSGSS
jgi:hypothetical protein